MATVEHEHEVTTTDAQDLENNIFHARGKCGVCDWHRRVVVNRKAEEHRNREGRSMEEKIDNIEKLVREIRTIVGLR